MQCWNIPKHSTFTSSTCSFGIMTGNILFHDQFLPPEGREPSFSFTQFAVRSILAALGARRDFVSDSPNKKDTVSLSSRCSHNVHHHIPRSLCHLDLSGTATLKNIIYISDSNFGILCLYMFVRSFLSMLFLFNLCWQQWFRARSRDSATLPGDSMSGSFPRDGGLSGDRAGDGTLGENATLRRVGARCKNGGDCTVEHTKTQLHGGLVWVVVHSWTLQSSFVLFFGKHNLL